jgi:flagella basal body P-ring formation protein FlgA
MRCAALTLLIALGAGGAAAEPVTLRRHAIVTEDVVTLGDLFANAAPELAARPLGPAPAPGQRWMLEEPQLSLIARDNGLGWRPLSADERMVVERPGRALPREAVAEALAEELATLGAPAGLEPDLAGYAILYLPEDAPEPRLMIEGARLDPGSRRFTATLLLVADGMPPVRQPLSGRMMAMRSAVVATRALRAGTVVGVEDVAVLRLPADRVPAGSTDDIRLVVGGSLRRAVAADRPVPLANVAPAYVVRKDSAVMLTHEAPGLAISAQGRALADAALGSVIEVLNLATGSVVHAEVTGPGRARPLGPATPSARTPLLRSADARP